MGTTKYFVLSGYDREHIAVIKCNDNKTLHLNVLRAIKEHYSAESVELQNIRRLDISVLGFYSETDSNWTRFEFKTILHYDDHKSECWNWLQKTEVYGESLIDLIDVQIEAYNENNGMRTIKPYTVNYKVANSDYGEITVPVGTLVSHNTALGKDDNYHFVEEFDWIDRDYPRIAYLLKHDAEHYGINVPKEYIANG